MKKKKNRKTHWLWNGIFIHLCVCVCSYMYEEYFIHGKPSYKIQLWIYHTNGHGYQIDDKICDSETNEKIYIYELWTYNWQMVNYYNLVIFVVVVVVVNNNNDDDDKLSMKWIYVHTESLNVNLFCGFFFHCFYYVYA